LQDHIDRSAADLPLLPVIFLFDLCDAWRTETLVSTLSLN